MPDQELTIQKPGIDGLFLALDRGCSISGRVLDSEGRPVRGASVRAHIRDEEGRLSPNLTFLEVQGETDQDGRYVVEGLPAHEGYEVTASHEDHSEGSVAGIRIGKREDVKGVDIEIFDGGAIRGRVTDEDGHGLAEAVVTVEEAAPGDPSRRYQGETRCALDGSYELKHLRPGTYSIKFDSSPLKSAKLEGIHVEEGKTTGEIDGILSPGESLSGQEGDRVEKQVRTEPDGKFEISGLPPGRYSLSAQEESDPLGAKVIEKTVSVQEGETSEVEIDFDR
jgi:protocatechuate 3,4-dioxygenase beta subunit